MPKRNSDVKKNLLLQDIRKIGGLEEKVVKNGIGFRYKGIRLIKFVNHKKDKVILPTLKNVVSVKPFECEYYEAKNVYYVNVKHGNSIVKYINKEMVRLDKLHQGKPPKESKKSLNRKEKLERAKSLMKKHEEDEEES